jgi:hypothetical protein
MKQKWKVQIPLPKSKRMEGTGVLVVARNNGWSGTVYDRYKIGPEFADAIFEIDDCYEWAGTTSIIDGDDFDVYIEYTNSTGSRKESVRLVPEKVGA